MKEALAQIGAALQVDLPSLAVAADLDNRPYLPWQIPGILNLLLFVPNRAKIFMAEPVAAIVMVTFGAMQHFHPAAIFLVTAWLLNRKDIVLESFHG